MVKLPGRRSKGRARRLGRRRGEVRKDLVVHDNREVDEAQRPAAEAERVPDALQTPECHDGSPECDEHRTTVNWSTGWRNASCIDQGNDYPSTGRIAWRFIKLSGTGSQANALSAPLVYYMAVVI
jgi:hypothetical protein